MKSSTFRASKFRGDSVFFSFAAQIDIPEKCEKHIWFYDCIILRMWCLIDYMYIYIYIYHVYLSIYLSVCLSIYLSIYLSHLVKSSVTSPSPKKVAKGSWTTFFFFGNPSSWPCGGAFKVGFSMEPMVCLTTTHWGEGGPWRSVASGLIDWELGWFALSCWVLLEGIPAFFPKKGKKRSLLCLAI